MENFIKTSDRDTAVKLIESGYKLINQSGSVWTFMNNKDLKFSESDKTKIVYSNKLEMV